MNLFEFSEKNFKEEKIEVLLDSKVIRIERILSDGHVSGWYDQEEAEWVSLLEGEAELEFEDRKLVLKKGESVLINPHEKHRVSKTGRCIWLCVFYKSKSETKYYTYLLQCSDNSLYCGYTNNIDKRVKIHNDGKGAKYTKNRLPVELVYYEEFKTKSEAMRRECEIKKLSKNKKMELIKRINNVWHFLIY